MSKNAVFYFTGTGNSLKAAKDIANKLGDCDAFLMPAYKERVIPAGYERIGFAFPVYLYAPPICVQEFLKEIDLSQNKDAYVFAVATYGGMQGNTYLTVNRLLADKGIALNAVFGVNMRPTYIVMYDMPKIAYVISRNSSKKIDAIAKRILKKEHTTIPKKESKSQADKNKKFVAECHDMDRDYNVSDGCTGCGLCTRVCSVQNIVIKSDGKPTFEHRCEQCMACIHACPEQAINYKNITQKRARYLNPDISVKELGVPRNDL
jgi:ferredoxin